MESFSMLMSVYAKEHAGRLNSALKSVLVDQTVKPFEVILVEDGPLTPELYEVLDGYQSSFANFTRLKLPENMGLGRALNAGLDRCSCKWVARMDSDDISMPNRFEEQMRYLTKYPDTDIVGTWMDEFEDNIHKVVSIKKVPENHDHICRFAKQRSPTNHPTTIFNKYAVIDAGGYLDFPFMEDYYLWVRMIVRGARFYNVQKSLYSFRTSADMYQRRGGHKYLKHEFKLQKEFRKIGFINFPTMIRNIFVRSIFRMIPNELRSALYKSVLRK